MPHLGGSAELPEHANSLLRSIKEAGPNVGAPWDLVAWRDGRFLFVEAKHRGKDQVRKSQLAWIDAALTVGIPLASFLMVEWGYSE